MENTSLIGAIICGVTFLIGLLKLEPYTLENYEKKAGFQIIVRIAYAIGFGLMTYDAYMNLGTEWWAYIIIFILFCLSLGAFIEARKPYPNAPLNFNPNTED